MNITDLPMTYTEKDAAKLIGVCSETLARERRDGNITYTMIRKRVRYMMSHLDEYKAFREARRIEQERLAEQRRIERREHYKALQMHYNRLRRSRRKQAMPRWANRDEIRKVYAKALRLRRETGEMYHVDHIVPLAGKTVCGLHVHYNLQILPSFENQSKGIRLDS